MHDSADADLTSVGGLTVPLPGATRIIEAAPDASLACPCHEVQVISLPHTQIDALSSGGICYCL